MIRFSKFISRFVETLNHMLNGSIGCGILGMGIAFKHGGLLFASILLTYTTVIAAYNQFILVSIKINENKYNEKEKRKKAESRKNSQ